MAINGNVGRVSPTKRAEHNASVDGKRRKPTVRTRGPRSICAVRSRVLSSTTDGRKPASTSSSANRISSCASRSGVAVECGRSTQVNAVYRTRQCATTRRGLSLLFIFFFFFCGWKTESLKELWIRFRVRN